MGRQQALTAAPLQPLGPSRPVADLRIFAVWSGMLALWLAGIAGVPGGGSQCDSGLISSPIMLLSICSSPAALPPQMESDGDHHKPALYLHCCPPRNSPQRPTSFPHLISLTSPSCQDAAVAAQSSLSDLVSEGSVCALQRSSRAAGFSGSSCTHRLGVV